MTTISRQTTWTTSQILTASALNGEFNNIVNAWNNHDGASSVWTKGRFTTFGVGANTISGTANVGMGTGTGNSEILGTASISSTSVGNGADTTEDTLHTYTLPANSLSANGKAVRITSIGRFNASATTKRIQIYFGATVVFDTGAAAFNVANSGWYIQVFVCRLGASQQRSTGWQQIVQGATVGTNQTSPTSDTTASIVIKSTGTANVANANEMIEDAFFIEFIN